MYDDSVKREFCWPSDQTLLALAADERVGHLVVADPFRSYVLSAARRRPLNLVEDFTVGGRAATRARPYRLRKVDSTDLGTVERAYQRYGVLLGQALARARGEQEPRPESATLVTFHPFAAAFCDAPWISKIVYLGEDDWATGEGVRQWWDLYKEAYRRIDERKATIFAVSAELAGRLSPRAMVAANGVIADVWRPRYPAPPRIDELKRPRATYTGSIGDRLDKDLVELTASKVGSLIFMGPHRDSETIEWLRSIDNVHVFGPVGQRELAATVQACDVGLIPHRDQAGIRAMSPLKLYEYLSAGLPVVSVDLPPIHGVDDERVQICRREDWAAGLSRALSMERVDEERRQRFIDEVSWQQRMRPVVDAAVG
ncbi:glycosyltransferase [Dactylosporangium sp. NPDC051484]|uniref:glycosyltransferase n=1 Tax=Dactylosporangium sp. NPDC051484 TaxID=3154942 RepID=UPI00344F651E